MTHIGECILIHCAYFFDANCYTGKGLISTSKQSNTRFYFGTLSRLTAFFFFLYSAATQDSEWYDPDALTTKDGVLEIEFAAFRDHDLDFRSGMLQSWNKLCFKGGIIEGEIEPLSNNGV